MKHIFIRVFVYFGLVIVAFTLLIGLLYSQFNRNNIVGTYRSQLNDLAKSVATRVGNAASISETETFSNYLAAIEDFGTSRRTDIYIFQSRCADTSSR